ncbi:MAG: PC4/YdbC family ssDNA-binding protein [Clostridia bacterium]|jgi:hypothetical protein|nr:PC4/YdbC family ssDNA-binding protein [Clostridia bacterium]
MAEIKFEILKHLGVISKSENGWTKEVNLISWNDRDPKIDIRDWGPNKEKAGKGITLTEEEFKKLQKIVTK